MSIRFDQGLPAPAGTVPANDEEMFGEWDLDISIIESGPEADTLIRLTDDGCGKTCQSACSTTCP